MAEAIPERKGVVRREVVYIDWMSYNILADIVVLIHFLWIVFLIFGAIPGIKNRAIRIFHITGLVFAFAIQVFDWYCPLTHLEVWLRGRHDPALAYKGSFIIYYLEKVIYIELSRWMVFALTMFILGFNLWFYLKKKK